MIFLFNLLPVDDIMNKIKALQYILILRRKPLKKHIATVLSQEEIATDIFSMWIETDLAKEAKAGQFIEIYPKAESMLLPRPISICQISPDMTSLRIVYRVAGGGTAEFSWYDEGDAISILGPCGNGFPIDKVNGKDIFCIGGGIGVPPMIGTAEFCADTAKSVSLIFGYRDELFLNNEATAAGNLYIATEDGSAGTKGNVLDAIKESNLKCDVIFACGPMPMLKAIKTYAEENNIEAYISLEERMACGVGACLGCVTKTKHIDEHSKVNNTRICTEGPVFDAKEVLI